MMAFDLQLRGKVLWVKKKSVKFDKDDRGYISAAKPCHNRKEEKT